MFNQQFLTLLKAGLPILNSLDLLIKRQKDRNLGQILENVRERVKVESCFPTLLPRIPSVPKIYTTTLMAGEKSGNIDEVLTRYINFQRLAMTFRKKLFVSLIYPTLLVTVVTIMVMFLFTYVVPKFAELFNSLDRKLPAITLFMLAVGTERAEIFSLCICGIGFGWICFVAVAEDGPRRRSDRPLHSERALAGGYPAEAPGGNIFPHAFDAAAGWTAAGAIDGDGRQFDDQPAHSERCDAGKHTGAGRPGAGQQSGGTEYFSRPGGGNA